MQELLGIPNYTHKVRSSDGSVIEVTANEDGAHRVEIDIPEPSSREPLLNAPRYGFWIDVRSPGELYPKKRFLVAKVDSKYRGHTNKSGAKNPTNGTWKVVGYDDMAGANNPIVPRMPVPKLGTRGWAGSTGRLHNHESWFGTGTMCEYISPCYFQGDRHYWFAPQPTFTPYTAGLFSAATHHATFGGDPYHLGAYGVATSSLNTLRLQLSEDAPTVTELREKFYQHIRDYTGSGVEQDFKTGAYGATFLAAFEFSGSTGIIVLKENYSPISLATYLYFDAVNLTESRMVKLSKNALGMCSISADGTRFVIPTIAEAETNKKITQILHDRYAGVPNPYQVGSDYPIFSAFRQLREKQFLIEAGDDYSVSLNYPDLMEVSVDISGKSPTTSYGNTHTGHWSFNATHTKTGVDDFNWTAITTFTSHAKVSLAAYRGNTLVKTTFEADIGGKSGYARVSHVYPGNTTEINFTTHGGYTNMVICATCLGDTPAAWTKNSSPTYMDVNIKIIQNEYGGDGSAGGYWSNVSFSFDDAWSNINLTEFQDHLTSNASAIVNNPRVYYDGQYIGLIDGIQTTVTSAGESPPCGAVGSDPIQQWNYSYTKIPVVTPYAGIQAAGQANINQAARDAASAAAAAMGASSIRYTQIELNQTFESALIVYNCGPKLYTDLLGTDPKLVIVEQPDPRAATRPLSIQNIKHNMMTNSTSITDAQWTSGGMYGVEAAVGVFDPMLGIVERMFSGYKTDTMNASDNVRLHLYEVKYSANANPVRVVKAEDVSLANWTVGSALDHYPRATYCGYPHGGDRSSVCFFGGKLLPRDYITGDFQTAAIVDGDDGAVIDLLKLCGLSNATDLSAHIVAYRVFICEIPEALAKQDWPPP
jgi:hypothetical protein